MGLFMFKLLTNNIDEKNYYAIKSMYFNTISEIRRDVLSITLFNIYINDLAIEIKNLNVGISIGNVKMSILIYVC